MYQLIDNFLESAKEMDDDIFPFIANKKEFVKGKDSVYYSGPYWDDLEARELIYSVLKGKWLSSGERVNKLICFATGSIGDIPGRFETMDETRKKLKKEGAKISFSRVPPKWFIKGNKDTVSFTIKDQGPGFSETNTEKIFKRFYSNRPEKFGEHSGLGLNIVKSIVEMHRGHVRALNRSDKQGGAEIEVELLKKI